MAQRGRPPTPGILTPAEERVLDHVRQGQSNAEIAVRLGISVNTVRYHVSNLLSKAGVSERGDLGQWQPSAQRASRAWRKRPSWLWLAFAGAGATGLAVAAAIALVVPSGVDDPAVDLPAGYRVYEAAELEAMGMVDVGPLFEMEDGSEPVLGTELRGAAAAVVVREGARVTLDLEPCCSYGTGAAGVLLQARAPWGKLAVRLFTAGTGWLAFEFPDTRPVVFSTGGPAAGSSGAWSPTTTRPAVLSADGRPIVGVRAWNAGNGPMYGDATRDALPAAVDSRGHLFVAEQRLDQDLPVDYNTGRFLRVGAAEVVARDWPRTPTGYPAQGANGCQADLDELGGAASCGTGGYLGLTAPFDGRLTCTADGAFRLEGARFVLVFAKVMVAPDHPRCAGPDRAVVAGERFEEQANWSVSAEMIDGRSLDVARSDSGVLYVGTGMAPDATCPCSIAY